MKKQSNLSTKKVMQQNIFLWKDVHGEKRFMLQNLSVYEKVLSLVFHMSEGWTCTLTFCGARFHLKQG